MKAATVLIVGRPSAGKSTLLNRLCGEHVAVVAPVPQTTRNRIRGILSEPRGQIVLIDTPGLHASERKLNRRLRSLVSESLGEVDLVLYLVDSRRAPGKEELAIASMLKPLRERLLVALTKVDGEGPAAGEAGKPPASGTRRGGADQGAGRAEVPGRGAGRIGADRSGRQSGRVDTDRGGRPGGRKGADPRREAGRGDAAAGEASRRAEARSRRAASAARREAEGFVSEHLPGVPVYPLSALTGEGVAELLAALFERSPSGEAMYPEEFYTDQPPEFRIAEVIRGEALSRVREEVPHSLYVEIADLELPAEEEAPGAVEGEESVVEPSPAAGEQRAAEGKQSREGRLWIRAFIVVERESQKGILVGRGGSMVKEIRLAAQREIARLFPYRVELDLRVKVEPNWRSKDKLLDRLIY